MANEYVGFPGVQLPAMPQSGLAGLLATNQYIQQRKAQEIGLQQMMQDLAQRRAEHERYVGQTSAELSKSGLEGMLAEEAMQTPGYALQITRGRMGTAAQQEGMGRRELGEGMANILPEFGENPLQVQMHYQQWRRSLPDNLRNQVPPVYVPDARKQIESAIEAQRKREAEMEKTRFEKGADYRRAIDVEELRIKRAQQQRAAKDLTLQQALRKAKTPSEQISVSTQILNDPESNDTLKLQAAEVGKQARLALAASLGIRMPPNLPGLPPHQAIQLLDQLLQGATSGQPTPVLKPMSDQEKLEYTARKHGITVDEVKRRMGIK